jgi:hypothetical protein
LTDNLNSNLISLLSLVTVGLGQTNSLMLNYSKATLLFAIGYVTAIGLAVIMNPLQPLLRSMIVFGVIQIVFTELHFNYLQKMKCAMEDSLKTVLIVGAYWAFLSFSLDILLFSIVVPGLMAGTFEFGFIGTQPVWYWLQFPMMSITGLVARITYLKVNSIQVAALQKEEIHVQ